MWVLSWKKYAVSKLATFVSILGALMRYAGVVCLFSSVIPAALICLAIGIGLHFGAEAIAKSKAAKKTGGTANAVKAADSARPVAKTPPAQSAPKPVQVNPAAPTQPSAASNGKIRCAQCGNLVSASNKFCTACGKPLAAEAPRQKKCLRCGAVADSTSKFCPDCGYELK